MSEEPGGYRVWRVMNLPSHPEHHPVGGPGEGHAPIRHLAGEDPEPPGGTSVCGLEVYDPHEDEWEEFHDAEGRDIHRWGRERG